MEPADRSPWRRKLRLQVGELGQEAAAAAAGTGNLPPHTGTTGPGTTKHSSLGYDRRSDLECSLLLPSNLSLLSTRSPHVKTCQHTQIPSFTGWR